MKAYSIRVPGKWVLAGEHSVLRGGTAIALPHPEFALSLSFEPGAVLEIEPGDAAPVVGDLIDALLGGRPRPLGKLEVRSTIPVGAGLGSSAALCVALTRWLSETADSFETARKLEDRFHGKSSGMDVAATLAGEPIAFSMAEGAAPLGVRVLPQFRFHDTQLRTRTRDCVFQVEGLLKRDPALAQELDRSMSSASRKTMEGLLAFDREPGPASLSMIAQGMAEARSCFDRWDLIPPQARELEEKLLAEGALAVKPTGAGGGGFLVSLWS